MIVIESPLIGVGKTELAIRLKKCMVGSTVFYEEADNEFLAPFYDDIQNSVRPSHWAFLLQFFYMDDRYFKHKGAQEMEWRTRRETIFDRSIWGDHGFALKMYKDGFMSSRDYKVYVNHRRTMENQLLCPNAVIQLVADPGVCVERIIGRMEKQNGRKCETAVTKEYLAGISEAYDEVVWPWFKKQSVPILKYDWNNFQDVQIVIEDLKKVLPSTQSFSMEECNE